MSTFSQPLNVNIANKKELVADLLTKAKQIEYLINSLPIPEPEEAQVSVLRRTVLDLQLICVVFCLGSKIGAAGRRDGASKRRICSRRRSSKYVTNRP